MTVGQGLTILELADEWGYVRKSVREACQISWDDNCSRNVRRGIVAVRSSDPDEEIEGNPGYFYSSEIVTDWSGAMRNINANQVNGQARARTYTFEYAVVDEAGNHGIIECQIATQPPGCGDADADGCSDCVNGPVDPANDGPDLDGDGLCDLGDPDDDNDGMDDGNDADPRNPAVCGDSDGDLCDDCVHGSLNPGADGADLDGSIKNPGAPRKPAWAVPERADLT